VSDAALSVCLALQAIPALTQEQRDVIYSLFDAHVDAGLVWVRKQGSQYIPAVDVNLTMSLAMIMQVRTRTSWLCLGQSGSGCARQKPTFSNAHSPWVRKSPQQHTQHGVLTSLCTHTTTSCCSNT
jgi:hypothetical protein